MPGARQHERKSLAFVCFINKHAVYDLKAFMTETFMHTQWACATIALPTKTNLLEFVQWIFEQGWWINDYSNGKSAREKCSRVSTQRTGRFDHGRAQ